MDRIIIVDKYHDGTKFVNGVNYIRISGGIVKEIGRPADLSNPGIEFGKDVEIQDYRGKTVTPGIIDSHNHFTLTALKMNYETDFGDAKSFGEVHKLILESPRRGDEGWILGYNINEFNLSEKRLPTSRELDKVVRDNPVFVTHTTEHYAICNTKALQISGITGETRDPDGGLIGRYEGGSPNGILYEPAAMDLVKGKIPEFTLDEYEVALVKASEEYSRVGITTVKDIGGTGSDIDEEKRIMALNEISEQKKLKIRVGVALPIFSLEDMVRKKAIARKIRENDFLKFAGYKLFTDGSSLSRTAWMKEVWNRDFEEIDGDNHGSSLWDMDNFRKVVKELSREDTTISIHAIGDRAIWEAVGAIKDAKSSGDSKATYTLIHCYIPSVDDIRDLENLCISIETQASFIYFSGYAIASNLGIERFRKLFPIKTMLDAGINVCNGSDSPVTTYDPLYGIVSTVNRVTRTGLPYAFREDSGESVGIEEAIMTYTGNCAKALKWKDVGSLNEGFKGDMVVWNKIPEKVGDLNSRDLIHRVFCSNE